MLVIRDRQVELLSADAVRTFEDQTYDHLRRYFPRHCELLGKLQMCQVIRHGCGRAKRYGLTSRCGVRTYVELMCILGSGFDCDLLMPWARHTLRDPQSPGEVARGDQLHRLAWHYVDEILLDFHDERGQPTTSRFVGEIQQLLRLGDHAVEDSDLPRFLQSLYSRIERVFPAKVGFVGERRVRMALALAVDTAHGQGVTSERGLACFATMRFILGVRFTSDPLLPWASSVLSDKSIASPDVKVDKLFAAGITFLRRWWPSTRASGE